MSKLQRARRSAPLQSILTGILCALCALCAERAPASGVALRNPVWTTADQLRDPSVLKTDRGYLLFYSRFSGADWASPDNWAVAAAFTEDFVRFESDRDVTPKGFASPGDVVRWHGRHLLPCQSYPARPTRLHVSESADLTSWSTPRAFLEEAAALPWNALERVIDPTFVIERDRLHCFFVGSTPATTASGKKIHANLLGHAVTRDPALRDWEILTRSEPLIGISPAAPDGVENVAIFKTGGHWTMIYSEGLARQHLALATSTDLVSWTLRGPVEIEPQEWMHRKYGAPFVWREPDTWRMILMGEDARGRTGFGLLSSADGTRWIALPERPAPNPGPP